MIMQKLLILLLALLPTASLWGQHEPIQPFEQELGVKVKILTLSNGKYQETFANDTLLRVGSVMYNQFTGEVISVIVNDTLHGEYNLKPEVVSRWLSPDPLAGKYLNWSPYNYTFNNPIIYADPDGRDAILVIKPGENGTNGTITVTLAFNYDKSQGGAFVESAVSSFQGTWGNGAASNTGNIYQGNSFNDIEVDGQKYNVTYQLILNGTDNVSGATREGTNSLTVLPDNKSEGSNYSEGNMNYKASQEKANNNTNFGHELSHVMGIGHNDKLKDENGKTSISAGGTIDRGVIRQDVVNSIQGALKITNSSTPRSVVTLTTDRGGSGQNTVNLKQGSNTVQSDQYPVPENQKRQK